jgi:hypothetical protein
MVKSRSELVWPVVVTVWKVSDRLNQLPNHLQSILIQKHTC